MGPTLWQKGRARSRTFARSGRSRMEYLNRAVLDGRVSRQWLEEEHPLDASVSPKATTQAQATPQPEIPR